MIQKIFAVYDSKSVAFMQPFFSNQSGSAMRAFGDEVVKPASPFYKHPGDYQLYEIGSIDDSSALLEPLVPAKLLCNGLDFVNVVKPELVDVSNGGSRE